MPTDYDPIARRYQEAKRQPWREYVEAFTLLGLLGDLAGLSAVDLACGEGHYTRRLAGLGASRVVGVDLSEGMIALARAQESAEPRGVDYLVRDCRDPGLPAEFDVASAAYLLNYATDRRGLAAMAAGVAACLRPGGRFVAVNAHPGMPFDRGATYRKYGFEVRGPSAPREGSAYAWVFHLEAGPVEVENYWLPADAYDDALRTAGFSAVRWHRPKVAPAAAAAAPPGYWSDLLDHPPIIALECLL